jgi:hypothetical protein
MDQLTEAQMETHVTILGWLHIVGNALMFLLGCFLFALLGGIGLATGEPEASRILAIVGVSVGAFLAILGVPGILAGIGLLRRRVWGRILALVVGFLGLLNFPVGTAIGVYSGWVLLQESASEYFR